jgi:hypothetical protein
MQHLTEPELHEPEITVTITGSNYYRLPMDVRESLDLFISRCNGATGHLSFTIPAQRFRVLEPMLKRLSALLGPGMSYR